MNYILRLIVKEKCVIPLEWWPLAARAAFNYEWTTGTLMQAPTQPISEAQLRNLECFFDGAALFAVNPELASLDLSDFEPIKVADKTVPPPLQSDADAVKTTQQREGETPPKKSEADILFA